MLVQMLVDLSDTVLELFKALRDVGVGLLNRLGDRYRASDKSNASD